MQQPIDETNDKTKTEEAHSSPTTNHQLLAETTSSDVKLHSTLDPIDQQPRKKLKLTEADKKRSVRMFGSLMGTLTKFQDETSKIKQTEAAKRRAAVESRLQAKLRIETEALHQLRAYELEETNLKHQVLRKADELGHLSEQHTVKFANKLTFSNFLHTSIPSKLKSADQNEPSLTTTYGRSSHLDQPLLWLPHKLLPEQKELIEDQRRAAREEVEKKQQQWEEERFKKQVELTKLEEARDMRLQKIEEEKAQARAKAGTVLPSTTNNANQNLTLSTSVIETSNETPTQRDPSELRQDTPEVLNDIGRDEDAVEY